MNAHHSSLASAVAAPVRAAQRGVGLVEILVAVLIIALGFTASARMQVNGMRDSQNAYHRSQAYFMASAMIDRMRANVRGVREGRYDDVATSASTSDPGCSGKACSAEELAQQDLHDWSVSLHSDTPLLPSREGVDAVARIVAGNGGRYRIEVEWAEVFGGETETADLSVDFVAER